MAVKMFRFFELQTDTITVGYRAGYGPPDQILQRLKRHFNYIMRDLRSNVFHRTGRLREEEIMSKNKENAIRGRKKCIMWTRETPPLNASLPEVLITHNNLDKEPIATVADKSKSAADFKTLLLG